MKCTILALTDCPLSSVAGPLEILSLANSLVPPNKAIDLSILGESDLMITCANNLKLAAHNTINNVKQSDLIIIGAIGKPSRTTFHIMPETLDWIRQQHQQGAQIVSICTGAFVLAATGLLDNKRATTHWACERTFKTLFPQVLLNTNALITQDGSLLCSGGASAYQDMTLLLVRQYYGDQIAHQCAKAILIDLDRQQQSRYAQFQPSRQHNDSLVHNVQDWLEKNVTTQFTIASLATQVHLSERQFKRRFKLAIGDSPLIYIQALRIEIAKHSLENSNENIAAIGHKSGYEDTRFFRQLFKRHTGLSPSEYRSKCSFPTLQMVKRNFSTVNYFTQYKT